MNDCIYCQPENPRRMGLMTFVCELPGSIVYLFRDQTYPGRAVVASKKHFREIFEMSDDERSSFFNDVALVAKILTDIFDAEKINYSIWGDKVSHTHVHLVPKTPQLPDWEKPFLHDPTNPVHIDEETFQSRILALQKALAVLPIDGIIL